MIPGTDIRSAARTHAGRVRGHNEDAKLERPEVGLWAVADGMGGHSRGEWASAQVVEQLSRIAKPDSAPAFIRDVRTAIQTAHDEISAAAERSGGDGVIGCTVVALLVFEAHFACLWAGDSRLYRLRANTLAVISRDHSRVQEMIDAQLLSEAAANGHPQANIITRAVGVGNLDLEVRTDSLLAGDVLLLCSDGLNKMLSDAEIAECLAGQPPDVAANLLVGRALDQGGRDNVTVVVVRWGKGSDEDDDATISGPLNRA